ncbi:MAG: serine/threonine-protein kinase [Polyangiaceae bacterium]
MNCPACEHPNVEGARYCAKCGILLPSGVPEGDADPLIGKTIAGRFSVLRLLGEGGMGRVYEAEKVSAGVVQRVAIKTLHAELSRDAQVVARFHREFKTVAGLKHPSTIKVEEFGQTPDGDLFIAMEFVEGKSVAKAIEEQGAMTPDRVEHIMSQVCGSLSEAHKQGIIHRDLKPENVVLMNVGDEVDFVKVLDFGIAAHKESGDKEKEQKLTQQGMVLGTPPYMSPEQFMGKELDARSDIYSLGVMVYEMLTGRLPFEANTPWEWATKHMTAQPTPFEAIPERATLPDVPVKMKNAIFRALSKKPEERHSTVREFFEDMSLGGARMSRATVVEQAPSAGGGGTEVNPIMAAATPSYPNVPPGGDHMASVPNITPPGMAANMPPPVRHNTGGGSSNKGLIIGVVAVLGVIGCVALVMAFSGGHKTSGGPLDLGSATPGGSTPVTTASSDTPSTSATTTTTSTPILPTTKPTTSGNTSVGKPGESIKGCCSALAAEAKKPGPNKGKYQSASGACYSLDPQVTSGAIQKGSALTSIRAAAGGAPMPGGCN